MSFETTEPQTTRTESTSRTASRANNWGRWGGNDERGALNLITPEAVQRGLAAVREGRPVSLAVPMRSGEGPIFAGRTPLQHFMTRHGGDYAAGLPEKGFGFADDYILLATHGTTHIDALAHVWKDGLMWNGNSANLVTSIGAARCGIGRTGPIVTRAILVDFADEFDASGDKQWGVGPDRLIAAVGETGIEIQPGDALLVRTGWLRAWREGRADVTAWPGLNFECAEWINEQGFAIVGADNIAVELGPSPVVHDAAPLHARLVRDYGIHLVELLNLNEVVTYQRAEFLLVISPMPLERGVGSPVNPVAIL